MMLEFLLKQLVSTYKDANKEKGDEWGDGVAFGQQLQTEEIINELFTQEDISLASLMSEDVECFNIRIKHKHLEGTDSYDEIQPWMYGLKVKLISVSDLNATLTIWIGGR